MPPTTLHPAVAALIMRQRLARYLTSLAFGERLRSHRLHKRYRLSLSEYERSRVERHKLTKESSN